MATRFFSDYLANLPAALGLADAVAPALESGGTVRAGTVRKPGYESFLGVNTPGRDIVFADFQANVCLKSTGVGSTALLLRPLTQIAKSTTDATLAGLSGSINDVAKLRLRLRREWNGVFVINGFTPTDHGPVANQAAMVALSAVVKYDYCERTDLSGAYRLFTGTDPTNAAQWVDEATAGFTHGTPAVVIDWGGPNQPNNPANLNAGHAPVSIVYWQTLSGIDYWGT